MIEFNTNEVESIIGYAFKNKLLLKQAFTRSDMVERGRQQGIFVESGEVLELIGDKVLYLVVMNAIIKSKTSIDDLGFHSCYNEGDLSNALTRYTCKDYLSSCIEELGLGDHLITGESEITISMLEDLFESITGAMYIDSNYSLQSISPIIIKLLKFDQDNFSVEKSPISILNEYCNKNKIPTPKIEFENLESVYVGRLVLPEFNIDISSYDTSKAILTDKICKRAFNMLEIKKKIKLPDVKVTLDNAINVLQMLAQRKFIDMPEYHLSFDYDRNIWLGLCQVSNLPYMVESEDRLKVMAKKKLALLTYNQIMKNYSEERTFNPFFKNTYCAVEGNKFVFYVHEITVGETYEMTKYPANVTKYFTEDEVLDTFIASPRHAIRKFIKDIYDFVPKEYKDKIEELPDMILSEDVSIYQKFIDEVLEHAKQ